MRRAMFAATAFALTGALAATAEDPKPVQPKVVPVPPRVIVAPPARVAALEEEVETLEAQRDAKKGHVKVAELGVRAAQLEVERLKVAVTKGIVPKEDFDRAALELETAKGRVEIRLAELKEVEVKLKYAKKRLDEAKGAAVRPVPADPKPRERDADAVEELKVKLTKLTPDAEQKEAETKKAETAANAAEKKLALTLEASAKGIGPSPRDIEDDRATVEAAKEAVEKLANEWAKLKDEIELLQNKLKAIEK